MTLAVLDASVALARCFPDETSPAADAAWGLLAERTVWAPAIWPLEVANVVLIAERSGRLGPGEAGKRIALLGALPVRVDAAPPDAVWRLVLPVARAARLSAYDAAYLELAVRLRASLATLDRKLAQAARQAGVTVLG